MQLPSPLGPDLSLPQPPSPLSDGLFLLDTRQYGAIPDGVTDNAAAFLRVNDVVSGLNYIPTIIFQGDNRGNVYLTTQGLICNRESIVRCYGAFIDYKGTLDGILMGPDGVNAVTEQFHRVYRCVDVMMKGGENAANGIRFNTFLTTPSAEGCYFDRFGNPNSWCITFQSSNWDSLCLRCRYQTISTDTVARNFIRSIGATTDGVGDNGQSQLRLIGCQATEQGSGHSRGVFFSGAQSQLLGCNIAGFAVCLQLGAFSFGSKAISSYFETTKGTETIRYGEDSGPQIGAYCLNFQMSNCYSNLHNTDAYSTTANLLGNATGSTGLQECELRFVEVVDLDPSREMVRQPANNSQVNNVSFNNKGWTILRSSGGGVVAQWANYDYNGYALV